MKLILVALALFCSAGMCAERVTMEGARSLIRSGRVVEGLRQIQELERRSPNDTSLQFEIGDILQELAASRADKLQKLAPGSPEVHVLLGKSLESHQKFAEAAAEYQLATQANPAMPGIHFLLGNLSYKQRKLEEAKPSFEQELKLNPDHSFANLRIGEILLVTDADAPQKAIPYLQKAVLDPHTGVEAHRELGKALRLSGNYKQAFEELQWVVRQKPDDEFVHAQLAALYRVQGDGENARKELEIQRNLLQSRNDAAVKAHQPEANR